MAKSTIEVKKVDRQGRVVLPAEWRREELGDAEEVFLIRGKGYIKLVPKRRPDITKYFDSVDLGVGSVEDWEEFEERYYEVH